MKLTVPKCAPVREIALTVIQSELGVILLECDITLHFSKEL